MKHTISLMLQVLSVWSLPTLVLGQYFATGPGSSLVYDGEMWYCSLKKEPVVEVTWSDDHGSYMDIEDLKNETASASSAVELDNLETHSARRCYCWYPTRQEYSDWRNNTNGTGTLRSFYCPLQFDYCGIQSRREPGRAPPTCGNGVRKRGWVQQVWRMANYATVFFVFLFIASYQGRDLAKYAFSYIFSFCVRPLNKWLADRILENEPSKANRMILHYFDRQTQTRRNNDDNEEDTSQRRWWRSRLGPSGYQSQRQQLLQMVRNNEPQQLMMLLPNDPELQIVMLQLQQQEEALARHRRRRNATNPDQPKPQSLLLKTRVYHASNATIVSTTAKTNQPSETEDTETPSATVRDTSTRSFHMVEEEEEEETTCSICYLELEEGERVGLLPHCNHTFHVDCLKMWLTKRNVCPLCLDENIATPQYGSTPAATTDEEVGDTGGNNTSSDSEESAIRATTSSRATESGGRQRNIRNVGGPDSDTRTQDYDA